MATQSISKMLHQCGYEFMVKYGKKRSEKVITSAGTVKYKNGQLKVVQK